MVYVDLASLVAHQAGVVRFDQARQFLTRAAIDHRLRSGRWRRASHGLLVCHLGPLSPDAARWLAVLGAGEGAVLAGLAAAVMNGLRRYEPRFLDVLVPAARRVRAAGPGTRIHRRDHLPREQVRLGRPRHTAPPRSLVDAAAWADTDDDAQAIIAAGFQQRLTWYDEIVDVVAELPRVRRRRLILQAAADADGGSHSLAEVRFLQLVRAARLPEPQRQVRRRDSAGRHRYLDAYFAGYGVHVEIDGAHHLDPATAWADLRRQNAIWVAGDRILRFPAWTVRRRPREVTDQVRAALLAAGWRPGSR